MKTFIFTRISIAVFALLCSMIFFSCQKEKSETEPVITEEQSAAYSEESSQVEASFDDVEDVSMIAAEEEGEASSPNGRFIAFVELRLRIGNCPVITVTPNDSTYPKTITIDFGNGCLGPDGKLRKGKIVVHLTGPIRRSGSVMTITFVDFYLNRAHIEGTKVVTNLSSGGDIKFTVQVVGGKLTFPNGRGFTHNSLKFVKQIEGGSTRIIRDDVYSIEGRSKTEFNGGLTINLNTERSLIKKVICPWISNGILKIKINSRELFLNYGFPNNGECDNKALLTWNNGQRIVILP